VFGTFEVVGGVRPIVVGTLDGALNDALIVRERDAGSKRLCRTGDAELIVRSPDRDARTHVLTALEERARTIARVRPKHPEVLVVRDDARLLRVLESLAATLRKWSWFAPTILMIVCGISAFSVNLLHGIERVHEFGVQRAVGARRTDLMMQLILEAAIVGGAALIPVAWLTLALVGLQSDASAALIAGLRAFVLGGCTAMALAALGVVLPGWQAIERSDISALERAGY